ncbi:hypothetical protein CDA63_05845 [Hymenobacter amundsenii]|uniref:DUF3592 domain-containing protein n=1 Tax=Hymenobacter amundsenii TaxID=2006685 RepID=A0A246FML1_9BACT|nr:DUF3592 domain-containing protein [Hymenobacter amundsenii]OWP63987.1 hypothetical protein CDA63_05845 [Hymenobacter amundsenii]
MLVFLGILLVVGSGGLCAAIKRYIQQRRLLAKGLPAVGHLVDWQWSGLGHSSQRKALVEFATPANQLVRIVTDLNTSSIMGFGPGDALHIRYSPTNVSECMIDESPLLPLKLQLALHILFWASFITALCLVSLFSSQE